MQISPFSCKYIFLVYALRLLPFFFLTQASNSHIASAANRPETFRIYKFKLVLLNGQEVETALSKPQQCKGYIVANTVQLAFPYFKWLMKVATKSTLLDYVSRIFLEIESAASGNTSKNWYLLNGFITGNSNSTVKSILRGFWNVSARYETLVDYFSYSIVGLVFICFLTVILTVKFVVFFRG